MSVDRREVERIAGLARLRLSDAEAERLTVEMNQILEHAMHLRRSAATAEAVTAEAAGAVDADMVVRGSVAAESVAGGRTTDGASGTRSDQDIGPDRLVGSLTDFAPHMVDGFFVVPPPPGVSAEADPDAGA